jgi:hypothetical protein
MINYAIFEEKKKQAITLSPLILAGKWQNLTLLSGDTRQNPNGTKGLVSKSTRAL